MKQQNRFSPPAIGGSSLLAIFAVLTLCVFALLSLSTVLAEKRLSEAAAQSVQRYYEAESQAEELLARLKNGDIPDNMTEEGIYRCTVPISGQQLLQMDVENTNGQWRMLRRQVVIQETALTDDTLPVWTGQNP